jgi:hypothetical protein
VEREDKEHVGHVLEATAKKVFRNTMSNARLQATNAFIKSRGVIIKNFWQYVMTFLITDEYAYVNDN